MGLTAIPPLPQGEGRGKRLPQRMDPSNLDRFQKSKPLPASLGSLTNSLLRDSVVECASPLALWLSAIPSLASLNSGESADYSPFPPGKG